MYDNKKIIDIFSCNIDKLEYVIKNRKMYNLRNELKEALLKSLIISNDIIPFIIAIGLTVSSASKLNLFSFVDYIVNPVRIEEIDTSSGIHLKNTSRDVKYKAELIQYTTGWTINSNGMYERTVISYRINNDLKKLDKDKILSMSNKEIEKMLIKTNVETISKNVLSPDDNIYKEDQIIIIGNSKESLNGKLNNDIINWAILVFGAFLCIPTYKKIEKLILKTTIEEKSNEWSFLYKKITVDDLEDLKLILAIRKRNLTMLNAKNNIPNALEKEDKRTSYNGSCYILRKTKNNKEVKNE